MIKISEFTHLNPDDISTIRILKETPKDKTPRIVVKIFLRSGTECEVVGEIKCCKASYIIIDTYHYGLEDSPFLKEDEAVDRAMDRVNEILRLIIVERRS